MQEFHKNILKPKENNFADMPWVWAWFNIIWQNHDKTNKMTCVPSEDSNYPGYLPSPISLHCPHEEI